MSWNTKDCFKALVTAFCDFQRQPSEQTTQDLQRQIDVILGVTSHGATLNEFTPKQLIYAETLSALVSIVNEPDMKPSLYLKSFMALSQLANDLETKVSLQCDFNLASSLVGFVLGIDANSNKQLMLQVLLLLEKMTYGGNCSINNIYMSDLLKYLVSAIYTTSSEFCMPSLAILANLCRTSVDVKSYVKSMSDAKQFGKILLSYLSNSNKSYVITSLSILTSLYLNDNLGEKMFSGHNLNNMVRVVFKILIDNDDVTTRHYSVDLIIDFIRCKKTLNAISEDSMLKSDIYKILNLLHSTDARTAAKIFELLIEFCKQQLLCKKVLHVFIKNSIVDVETQVVNGGLLSPAEAIHHWIAHFGENDYAVQANLLSLIFLKAILDEAVSAGSVSKVTFFMTRILPTLLPFIYMEVNVEDAKQIKQRLRKMTSSFEVLLSLCNEDGVKDVMVKQIDLNTLVDVIVNIINKFSDDLNALRNPALECSTEIIFLVFRGLELISTLKHDFESGTVKYSSLIQDPKLIPLLSYAIRDHSKYLVHAGVQIIAEGLKAKTFQTKALGDSLILYNTQLKEHVTGGKEQQTKDVVYQQPQPLREITNVTHAKSNIQPESPSITMLTEKLKKGLDMKDAKVSDIMDFYEHKLSALVGREHHMQDILEGKSTTLVQTERLLAQYRCRHAQSEAECLKLRSMLQTSERKCEIDKIKLCEFANSKEKLVEDVKLLKGQVKVLEAVAAEHEELTILFQEQSQKLESVQKSLQAAEEEHDSLVSMNSVLVKNTEMLKGKLDGANERLRLLEEEKQGLLGDLKDKEKEMKKVEKSLKESKGESTKLGIRCQELQHALGEKENAISQLNSEVEKQSQIAAMIHNLTMGKLGNLSNS